MFPEVSGAFSGSVRELQQHLKSLQGTQNRVTATFAATTGHSRQDAGRLFSHGKVYSGSEARQVGLVDRVVNIQPS